MCKNSIWLFIFLIWLNFKLHVLLLSFPAGNIQCHFTCYKEFNQSRRKCESQFGKLVQFRGSFSGKFLLSLSSLQVTQNLNCLSAWLILNGIQQVLALTPATILERKDSTKAKGPSDGGQKARDGSATKLSSGKRYWIFLSVQIKTIIKLLI